MSHFYGEWKFEVLENGDGVLTLPDREVIGNNISAGCWEKTNLPIVRIGFAENLVPDGRLMATAPELLGCVDDTIRRVCIESGCHAYNLGSCMNADGLCYSQKLLKIAKKARGES